MKLLDLHLGRPLTRGALTLFPVWSATAVASRGYDLRTPHLTFAERAGSPVVGELVATNGGSRPALVLDGELLTGGQQHRVCSRSVLVPAGGSLVLDVACVEQGRWSGGTGHVRDGRRAPAAVRAADGQGAVWAEVGRYEQRFDRSATHSLLDATGRAERAAADTVAGLRPLPFQSGVLVGLAGKPVLLECFDSPRTLAHAWGPLLQSLALDAARLAPLATPGRRARRFVDHLTAVPLVAQPAGAGTGVQGRSAHAAVSGLVWRDRAVAVAAINPRHELVAA